MSMPATFYTEIGFATKANYIEFSNRYPEKSLLIEHCIQKHMNAMKQECRVIVNKFRPEIQKCEDARKLEAKRHKDTLEQMKRETELLKMEEEKKKTEEKIKKAITEAMTKPIEIEDDDIPCSQKRTYSKSRYSTSTSRALSDSETEFDLATEDEVDRLKKTIEKMSLVFEDERKEMNGYILFLESECERLQKECIDWRKDFQELCKKHIELKKLVNSEIITTLAKKRRRE